MVDILIPMHITHFAQTDVCAGIKVTIENQMVDIPITPALSDPP
jgi:hypothetical protein